MKCFYEDHSSQVGHKSVPIVPRTSAEIGDSDSTALDADHTGICKFDSLEDPNYTQVRDALQSWVADIKAANSKSKEANVVYLTFWSSNLESQWTNHYSRIRQFKPIPPPPARILVAL